VPRSFVDSDVNDSPGGSFGIRREVPTDVAISVYDVTGRRVKDIFASNTHSHVVTFTWDGTNANNERLPSGIYFIKATAGTAQEVRKAVVVR
jgi:flagellar hook assembly protein FlgD